MRAISAYMAYKTREGGNDRRSEYHNPGTREYENRSEYDGQRQPNQYTQRNAMGTYWPQDNEMRRRRDSNGRYMTDYDGGAESRYRGRDGRWKSGTRRSEYDGGADESDHPGRRMGDDDDDMQGNVIQWPYAPDMPPDSRMIGFGNQPREYDSRSHYDGGRQEANVGGTMWMQPTEKTRSGMMMFDRDTAEEWVHNMRNEDKNHPHGGKWTPESLKPFAQKYNIQYDTPKFWQFYAMTNAMYSDYSEVARKFGITSPEFYACMAKAFMDDRDAEPDKVARYYEYIAKK